MTAVNKFNNCVNARAAVPCVEGRLAYPMSWCRVAQLTVGEGDGAPVGNVVDGEGVGAGDGDSVGDSVVATPPHNSYVPPGHCACTTPQTAKRKTEMPRGGPTT